MSNGKITSERTPLRAAVEGSLGAVIDTSKLNLDSSGAFTVAQQTAARSHVTFTSADYALRVDEQGNPIWQVALRREGGEPAGHDLHRRESRHDHPHGRAVHRRRRRGRAPIARTKTDRTVREDDEDDDGDTNLVKLRIKRAFHQVRDDVKRSFLQSAPLVRRFLPG